MRIGFDVSQTGYLKAGCGFYAESLIQQLALLDHYNTYILYPCFGTYFWDNQYHATFTSSFANFQTLCLHKTLAEAATFWHNQPETLEQRLGFVDIVHANNFFCPNHLKKCKIIYTLYDLNFMEYPEYSTLPNRKVCFAGVFKASLYADAIIAISDFSRNHFLEKFPHYPAERVVTIHPGSRFNAEDSYQTILTLPAESFWLHVGTIEPRKNIKYLLQNYAHYRKTSQHHYPLILAGNPGWLCEDLDEWIKSLDLTECVKLLGYVSHEQLGWLYQHCFSLVYPSLFEGFGLPLIEAMTFAKSFITSTLSALPEIAGHAGILIDPFQPTALCDAMLMLEKSSSYRQQLEKRSTERIAAFAQQDSALKILDLYKKVMEWPKFHQDD